MSARSSVIISDDEYLDFEDADYSPRGSTSEHHDFLQDERIWERHDRARQMVRYRGGRHYGADQQRLNSRHLEVPIYEKPLRRPRATSDTRSDARNYQIKETGPESQTLDGRDPLRNELLRDSCEKGSTSSRAPAVVITEMGSSSSRPAIHMSVPIRPYGGPPKIIQPGPPRISIGGMAKSSESGPLLRLKYLQLQDSLVDVRQNCRRFVNVEAANPRDLTFAKITDQVKGFEHELEVWHYTAKIDDVPRSDLSESEMRTAMAVSRILDRLADRAVDLDKACKQAKPGDLKLQRLPEPDEDKLYTEDDGEATIQDPTESLNFIIDSSLHSIELQIQSLKRLIRSVQELTPDAKKELDAIARVVGDTVKYFGSDGALEQFPVGENFAGKRALDEARRKASR